MMYEFKLADLGEGMHEAEIVQWLINVGDTTKLDQAIAKVETDKAVVDLPSPVAGRVSEIRFNDGDGASKQAEISAATAPTSQSTVLSTQRPRVQAAPAVRKLAFELGVELEQVPPSSPSGRISLEDV